MALPVSCRGGTSAPPCSGHSSDTEQDCICAYVLRCVCGSECARMCPAHVHTYGCACMGDIRVGERTRASVHTYGHEYEGMCVLHAFTGTHSAHHSPIHCRAFSQGHRKREGGLKTQASSRWPRIVERSIALGPLFGSSPAKFSD